MKVFKGEYLERQNFSEFEFIQPDVLPMMLWNDFGRYQNMVVQSGPKTGKTMACIFACLMRLKLHINNLQVIHIVESEEQASKTAKIYRSLTED